MEEQPTRFDGHVAFVTGAGSGIGRARALSFAKEGAHVAVVDLNAAAATETASMVQALGREAAPISADVTRAAEVERAVRETVEVFGRLDVAFNNAGGGRGAGIIDTTEEDWDAVQNLNLKAIWLCMKHQAPEMSKVGGGAIVNTSSITAWRHFAGNNPAYVSSKQGQLALTRYAAVEFADRRIRVNAILPGIIETPLSASNVNVDLQKVSEKYHPMKRPGRSEEVANVVLFLCSSEASFVTGVTIPVDGGWSAK